MSTRPRRAWLLLAPVLAALPVAAWLARDGALLVHHCVPDGAAGRLGLRMALLRTDLDCPSGLAVGGEPGHVMGIALMIAVPVLVAHLVGAGLGVGAAAAVGRVLAAVSRVLGGRARRVAPPVALVLTDPASVPPVGRSWSVVPVGASGAPWRRGPPAAALG